MAGSHSDILGALETHLAAFVTADAGNETWSVEWPNREFRQPSDGTPYMRPVDLPVSERAAALGADAKNDVRGIFQVTIFVPAGGGKGRATRAADRLTNHFKRGTTLTQNTVNVRIIAAERRRAIPEPIGSACRWMSTTGRSCRIKETRT